jgi:hypothetical protein
MRKMDEKITTENVGGVANPLRDRQDKLLKSLLQFYQDKRRRPTANDVKNGKVGYSERAFRRAFGSLDFPLALADDFQSVHHYETDTAKERQERIQAVAAKHNPRPRGKRAATPHKRVLAMPEMQSDFKGRMDNTKFRGPSQCPNPFVTLCAYCNRLRPDEEITLDDSTVAKFICESCLRNFKGGGLI